MFNKDLQEQLDAVTKQRDDLLAWRERQLTEQAKAVKEDLAKASFVFDWAARQAFSIERITDHGQNHTVIGYITQAECIGQWVFYCSLDEHNRLVEEFKAYLAKPKAPKVQKKTKV